MDFSVLKGKKVMSITKVIDMMCLNIGSILKIKIDVREIWGPEYSFHLQCPWIIRDGSKILLGSRDIYEPYYDGVEEEWDYSEKHTNQKEQSVFEFILEKSTWVNDNMYIEDIHIDDFNNIKMFFSNGLVFQTFISGTKEIEYWRFINFHTRDHVVIYEEEEQ